MTNVADGTISGGTYRLDPILKVILGIVGAILSAAVTANFVEQRSQGQTLTAMAVHVEHLREDFKSVQSALNETRANVRALEILMARIDENHDDMKDEVVELRKRLTIIEHHSASEGSGE